MTAVVHVRALYLSRLVAVPRRAVSDTVALRILTEFHIVNTTMIMYYFL